MESAGIVFNISFFLNVLSGTRLACKFYLKQHLVLAVIVSTADQWNRVYRFLKKSLFIGKSTKRKQTCIGLSPEQVKSQRCRFCCLTRNC